MTEPHPMIYAALIDAARMMEGLEKGGENKSQGFKFRGIEQLTTACAPIFKAAGIVVVPTMHHVEQVEQPGKGYRAIVEADYTFYAEDGSHVTARTIGEGVDSYDKATNKAMTAAFKYALLQTLCIGDPADDGDGQAPEKEEKPKAPARTKNEVSAEDWKTWEGMREQLLADEDHKNAFVKWLSDHSVTAERSMTKVAFDKMVEEAGNILYSGDQPA